MSSAHSFLDWLACWSTVGVMIGGLAIFSFDSAVNDAFMLVFTLHFLCLHSTKLLRREGQVDGSHAGQSGEGTQARSAMHASTVHAEAAVGPALHRPAVHASCDRAAGTGAPQPPL